MPKSPRIDRGASARASSDPTPLESLATDDASMAARWRQAAEDSSRRDLSSFLDWLRQRFVLGEWTQVARDADPRLQPARIGSNELLAEYYEIDLEAVERHVQRLLRSLRTSG